MRLVVLLTTVVCCAGPIRRHETQEEKRERLLAERGPRRHQVPNDPCGWNKTCSDAYFTKQSDLVEQCAYIRFQCTRPPMLGEDPDAPPPPPPPGW